MVWLKLLRGGVKVNGIGQKLSFWRKLDNSLSSSSIQKIFDGYKVYRVYLKFNAIKSLICLFLLSINYLMKK